MELLGEQAADAQLLAGGVERRRVDLAVGQESLCVDRGVGKSSHGLCSVSADGAPLLTGRRIRRVPRAAVERRHLLRELRGGGAVAHDHGDDLLSALRDRRPLAGLIP